MDPGVQGIVMKVVREKAIVAQTPALSEVTPRQLAFRLVDDCIFWTLESTVYRIPGERS